MHFSFCYTENLRRLALSSNCCLFKYFSVEIKHLFDLSQAQRCVSELRTQVNRLEAEMEEQRTSKQVALVENEHLRMEVEALRSANVANVGAQIGYKEADSECTILCSGE